MYPSKYTTDYVRYRNTMNRDNDWQATLDYYEAGDPIGSGPTEIDALQDLLLALEELEEPLPEEQP